MESAQPLCRLAASPLLTCKHMLLIGLQGGGFSQPLGVAHRRRAEEPLVLTGEVRGVAVAHAAAGTPGIEVLAEHEAPGLLEAHPLLELQRAGLLVGLVGSVLGVFDGLDWWEGLDWWILQFAGLTVVGVGIFVEDASRLLGALVLASSALGWVSLLTDPAFSGVLVPMRQVHVAFAVLFCLSCIAWGWVLFRAVSKRT